LYLIIFRININTRTILKKITGLPKKSTEKKY